MKLLANMVLVLAAVPLLIGGALAVGLLFIGSCLIVLARRLARLVSGRMGQVPV